MGLLLCDELRSAFDFRSSHLLILVVYVFSLLVNRHKRHTAFTRVQRRPATTRCLGLGAGTSPLTDTGGCVQSWVAHHGVRGGAPEENFASKTIFRTKNAYSEDVKHFVQKLSSRPPRIWAHSMM